MKILVVGYGSMGRRRIRLLQRLVKNVVFICVDKSVSRLQQIRKEGFLGYENLEQGSAVPAASAPEYSRHPCIISSSSRNVSLITEPSASTSLLPALHETVYQ